MFPPLFTSSSMSVLPLFFSSSVASRMQSSLDKCNWAGRSLNEVHTWHFLRLLCTWEPLGVDFYMWVFVILLMKAHRNGLAFVNQAFLIPNPLLFLCLLCPPLLPLPFFFPWNIYFGCLSSYLDFLLPLFVDEVIFLSWDRGIPFFSRSLADSLLRAFISAFLAYFLIIST